MKKCVLLICFIVLITTSAHAQGFMGMVASQVQQATGGTVCAITTKENLNSGLANQGTNVGQDAATDYIHAGSSFTASSTYYITSITVRATRAGTGSGANFTVKLWTDSSGSPGTVLQTSSTVAVTSDFGSATTKEFLFSTGSRYQVQSGTTYWVTLTSDGVNATNYLQLRWYDTVTGFAVKKADATPTWTILDSMAQLEMVINGGAGCL